MNAGRLNRRARIEALTDTADGQGGFTRVWAELGGVGNGGVWIEARPAGGNATLEAGVNLQTQAWSFTMRFRSDVTTAMRLAADWLPAGHYIAIESLNDPDGRRHWLKGTGTASAF
ncbi:MAG: phage head closure protein [Novosphingobium meiothermophilum]